MALHDVDALDTHFGWTDGPGGTGLKHYVEELQGVSFGMLAGVASLATFATLANCNEADRVVSKGIFTHDGSAYALTVAALNATLIADGLWRAHAVYTNQVAWFFWIRKA